MDDLLFFGGGSLLLLSIPVAIVIAAVRAKRRNASNLMTLLSALGAGFITAVIAVLIGWVGLMIMWGLSA
ncbi:MAG: hypothetical protein P8P40_08935 [Sulfitobacter sp.]|nr:hypothetical protein [Sulfitobacter sp.]MDG1351607.1 hypothetical protein [Sulfitobacter sp.]